MRLTRSVLFLAALGGALSFTTALHAQAPAAAAPASVAVPAPGTGPVLGEPVVGVRAHVGTAAYESAPVAELFPQDRSLGAGRNVAMMLVGGAAVVTGLIIGDDAGTLLAVGGAIVGLYGLYQFLK